MAYFEQSLDESAQQIHWHCPVATAAAFAAALVILIAVVLGRWRLGGARSEILEDVDSAKRRL